MATLTHSPHIHWHAGARRYLVEIIDTEAYDVPMGQVVDLDLGMLYAPQPMAVLLARGEWQQLDPPIEAEGILERVR